jgi:hypothetical protein
MYSFLLLHLFFFCHPFKFELIGDTKKRMDRVYLKGSVPAHLPYKIKTYEITTRSSSSTVVLYLVAI